MPITTDPHFTREEVGLALRNPGMPLEALRHDVTPIGMHYVLVHFDIPNIDAARYQLVVDGRVGEPLALTLEDLRSQPAVSMPVMMECAGSGRAHLAPRPVSAPWHDEAIGCATWTGTPLREHPGAGRAPEDAVEVLFTGHDRGIDQGVEQDYQRSLPVGDAMQADVLACRDERCAAAGTARLPAQADRPRLVRHGFGQMARRSITAIAQPFEGVQQTVLHSLPPSRGRPRHPGLRARSHAP